MFFDTQIFSFSGRKHPGIFRVPGAAQEISEMKVAFEEGSKFLFIIYYFFGCFLTEVMMRLLR